MVKGLLTEDERSRKDILISISWEAMETPAELKATIFDLTRRVSELEKGLYGHLSPHVDLVLMLRCYRDAHSALRGIEPQSAGVWVAQAYLWNVRMLQQLGRAVADPYPFRPLLAVLDLCVLQSIPNAQAALEHLEGVAQDLLSAEGLEVVQPRDVMGSLQMHAVQMRLATTPM
jgi:hypothetical protein